MQIKRIIWIIALLVLVWQDAVAQDEPAIPNAGFALIELFISGGSIPPADAQSSIAQGCNGHMTLLSFHIDY